MITIEPKNMTNVDGLWNPINLHCDKHGQFLYFISNTLYAYKFKNVNNDFTHGITCMFNKLGFGTSSCQIGDFICDYITRLYKIGSGNDIV